MCDKGLLSLLPLLLRSSIVAKTHNPGPQIHHIYSFLHRVITTDLPGRGRTIEKLGDLNPRPGAFLWYTGPVGVWGQALNNPASLLSLGKPLLLFAFIVSLMTC